MTKVNEWKNRIFVLQLTSSFVNRFEILFSLVNPTRWKGRAKKKSGEILHPSNWNKSIAKPILKG
jgi:hypothetical protein